MDTIRLLFFTTVWTAIWASPLPKLTRRVELVAGLIPFAAFGLRVFGACFIGVAADDPVRMAVAPLVDWINGVSGTVPFQWVLDVTVAIGLVWLASIADIPRRWRLATIWVMPAVALASLLFARPAVSPKDAGPSPARTRSEGPFARLTACRSQDDVVEVDLGGSGRQIETQDRRLLGERQFERNGLPVRFARHGVRNRKHLRTPIPTEHGHATFARA